MSRHPAIQALDYIRQFVTGTAFILALLLMFQFAWQYWGCGLDTESVSQNLEKASTVKFENSETDKIGQVHTGTPPIERESADDGELIGYLRIPRLGKDWRKPIQEGTESTVLNNMGVGHYTNTAFPGQPGNTSFAGHRAPADLGYINQLQVGDEIIVEGSSNWYVYLVNKSPYVVPMSTVQVISPSAAGAVRGLTLTTCDPMFSPTPATERLIVHAEFQGWIPKDEGMPENLVQTRTTTSEQIKRSVQTVSHQIDAPVTGVLALCLFLIWAILDCLMWLLCYKRMMYVWSRPTSNPLVIFWRLQAGPLPMPGGAEWKRVLANIVRGLMFVIFWTAVMFICFRFACPWAAEHVPFLETPHPSVG